MNNSSRKNYKSDALHANDLGAPGFIQGNPVAIDKDIKTPSYNDLKDDPLVEVVSIPRSNISPWMCDPNNHRFPSWIYYLITVDKGLPSVNTFYADISYFDLLHYFPSVDRDIFERACCCGSTQPEIIALFAADTNVMNTFCQFWYGCSFANAYVRFFAKGKYYNKEKWDAFANDGNVGYAAIVAEYKGITAPQDDSSKSKLIFGGVVKAEE